MYIPKVDKEDIRPYYLQIASNIRQKIASGEIPAGAKLPPVNKWAPVIGVNLHTLNRAINNLVKEGLLNRKTRMGTFVNQFPENNTIVKKAEKPSILVLLPDDKRLETPYTQEVLKGVYAESEIYNFNVEVNCIKNGNYPSSWKDFFAKRKHIKGLILDKEGFLDKHLLTILTDFKGPKVIINSLFHLNNKVPSVVINYECASFIATEYLIQKGHERIAIITRSREGRMQYRSDMAKIFGYRSALEQYGLDIDKAYQKGDVDYDSEKIKKVAEELLALRKPPTAIFATDDFIAFKLLQILQKKKINVPGDISIVGFYNLLYSQAVSPQITTIATPNMELGKKALELIVAEKTEHFMLEGFLLERETVRELSTRVLVKA